MEEQEIREQNQQVEADNQQQIEQANQQQELQQMHPVGAGNGQIENQENNGEVVEEEIEEGADDVPAGGAPAVEDDLDEQEEDHAILDNAPQRGEGDPAQVEHPAQDEVNQDILDAAREAGGNDVPQQEQGDPNRAFDTLEDLKGLDAQQNQAPEGEDGLQTLRESVMKFRKGNIYKAVIYAKMLDNGEQPANANNELNAPKPGTSGNRFSRFVNSSSIVNNSTLDKVGQVTKLTNAASGLLGMASGEYKDSKISSLITLASDVMVLVNSVRSIMKKLANFKKTNTSVRKKAFGVISIVSDFCMAVSKGAAIAKFIAGKLGHEKGLFAKVMNHLSNFAAMAAQVTALTGVINTMEELASNKRQLKKDQKEEEANVEQILNRLDPGENLEEAGHQGAEQEGAQPQPKKRRRLDLKRKKHLKEKIYAAIERPELSADDKAVLASYLGRERTISKRKLALANVSHGLISLVLGLCATGSKTTMDLTGGADMVRAAKSALITGGAANSSVLLFAAGNHIGKTATDAGRDEGEVSFVKDAFWGTLHNMAGDDRYGLRRVAARLTPQAPGEDAANDARAVLGKYGAVTKQFFGSGVNFPKLFAANDVETFKEALAAGL